MSSPPYMITDVGVQRVVVVTPAGRRRYLRHLHAHLLRQRQDFAEWHLWLNTTDPEDQDYMVQLQRRNASWVRLVTGGRDTAPLEGNANIHRFFAKARDPDTLYIRLDDDVVFLDDDFVRRLAAARLQHLEPLLVFAHIVNNGVVAAREQAAGLLPSVPVTLDGLVMGNAWKSAALAANIHADFLAAARAGDLERWRTAFEAERVPQRVSINAVAFLGRDMAHVEVDPDEEEFLTTVLPARLGRPNLLLPAPLCAHYAYYTQRPGLEATQVLHEYGRLAGLE